MLFLLFICKLSQKKSKKLKRKKHQIVRFKEPEAVSQLSHNYEVIGDDGDNFSNRHQNKNMNFFLLGDARVSHI